MPTSSFSVPVPGVECSRRIGGSPGFTPVKPRFLRLPRTRLGAVVIVLVVCAVGGLLLLRVIRGDLPSETEKAEQIGQLKATVLPVLEDLQVEYFMDAAGCAILTYPRG